MPTKKKDPVEETPEAQDPVEETPEAQEPDPIEGEVEAPVESKPEEAAPEEAPEEPPEAPVEAVTQSPTTLATLLVDAPEDAWVAYKRIPETFNTRPAMRGDTVNGQVVKDPTGIVVVEVKADKYQLVPAIDFASAFEVANAPAPPSSGKWIPNVTDPTLVPPSLKINNVPNKAMISAELDRLEAAELPTLIPGVMVSNRPQM